MSQGWDKQFDLIAEVWAKHQNIIAESAEEMRKHATPFAQINGNRKERRAYFAQARKAKP